MNGKECVRRAIAREPVPYVPLGFYCADYEIVEAVLGRETFVRNKIKCQLAFWEGRRDEVADSFKRDAVDFYRKVDCCDLIAFKEAPLLPPKDYEPPKFRRLEPLTWELEDGSVWRASELTNDITCVKAARSTPRPEPSAADYEALVCVEPPDPSVFEAFDYLIEHLGGDRYIAGYSGGFSALTSLPGENGGLLGYYLMPDVVRAAARQNLERQRLLDAWYIRPGIAGILFEEDMAASKGPMVSPEIFREFCLPNVKARIADMHALGYQAILHNCGNNRPLMNQFVEAGLDCYQSLQTIPDMELSGLRRDFGATLAFWGGIALEVLLTGTPEECRANVRSALERGAAPCGRGTTGGLILGPSHSIAKGTGYDNFMSALDEYMRLRTSFV